jgi:hypothetical protein
MIGFLDKFPDEGSTRSQKSFQCYHSKQLHLVSPPSAMIKMFRSHVFLSSIVVLVLPSLSLATPSKRARENANAK